MSSSDYSSTISLLPTIGFLETIPKRQWSTDSEYYVGFSTVPVVFHASENNEVICLNSETDLLNSGYGTAKIKNPFAYTRPELSPVLSVHQRAKVLYPKQIPQSAFLYRLKEDDTKEIIFASNFTNDPQKKIEAPLVDCFSRECMTWFDSNIDFFIGFGTFAENVGTVADGDSIAILTSSEDLLLGAIDFSTASISPTDIQVVNTVSILTPFVQVQFATGVEYINTDTAPDPSFLFLYTVNDANESMVAFVHDFKKQVTEDMLYGAVTTEISWNPEDVVIF